MQTHAGRDKLRRPEAVPSGTTEAARAATELMHTNPHILDSSDPSTRITSHLDRTLHSNSSNTDNDCTGHAQHTHQQASDTHSHRQAFDIGKPQQVRLAESDIRSHTQTSSENDSLTKSRAERLENAARRMAAETPFAMLGVPKTMLGVPNAQEGMKTHTEGTGRRQLKRAFSLVEQEDISIGMDKLDSLDKVPLRVCVRDHIAACPVACL